MTNHFLYHADARDMSYIPDKSVHLVLTSPPYFNLKEYRKGKNQLSFKRRVVRQKIGILCDQSHVIVGKSLERERVHKLVKILVHGRFESFCGYYTLLWGEIQ